ncbi:MAG TPA: biotin/lipoyl-containing protein [Pseudonocardia sp.]|nr:biotin/lipoyl-containing protein [Pseudonocardia sp.]
MDPDLGSLHKVLTAFENGEWDEVHLVTGEFELHLTTAVTDGHSAEPLAARAAATATAPAAVTTNGATPTNGAAASDSDVAETAGAAAPIPPNGVLVEAPSVGIFWAAPSPGAPPFVNIGDDVNEGSTLCIVEVMKLMNHLKSPAVGRVVDVLVKNGDSLVAGQPVFVIDPDAAAGA